MMKHTEDFKQEAVRIALTSGLSRRRVDLPPSGWSKIYVIFDTEGKDECHSRNTRRRRLSASCVKQRLCWRREGRQRTACRQLSISEQTYYRWRKEYGGLKTDQARRMKDLEKENTRLRRAISDLTLDKLILQEAARGSRQACKAQTTEPRATAALY